eukprot:TRINITY_DN1032_c1_g1_i3.p1 TRINITY_DN1032_c1_g1~~TRINITY_DN1032_c1_g1_i3.p1  ORF type:complete len:134 (+),score=25.17 TRINITY_DN1032_c1_g1_i3:290-691(+)
MFYVFYWSLGAGSFWAALMLVPVVAMLPDVIYKYYQYQYNPAGWLILRERQELAGAPYATELSERSRKTQGLNLNLAEDDSSIGHDIEAHHTMSEGDDDLFGASQSDAELAPRPHAGHTSSAGSIRASRNYPS